MQDLIKDKESPEFFAYETTTQLTDDLWIGGFPNQQEIEPFKVIISVAGAPMNYRYVAKDGQLSFSTYFLDCNRLPNEDYLHGIADLVNRVRKIGPTLVHCAAGLNRSGLICGLALVKSGMTPTEAIQLMRYKRSSEVLFNQTFYNWLIKVRA